MGKYFRDNYTDFTFNGVRSSQMNVWITNSRDIKLVATPEFSDTFITPLFGNQQIYSNTNITKSTFSVQCIAINITLNDWRAIQQWLSPNIIGHLEFDFNDRTYYNAKISKAISGVSFVQGTLDSILGDLHIVTFSVEFVTVGDFAAKGPVNTAFLNTDFNETTYTIESVSNNRYFMPTMVKLPTTITGAKPILLRNRPISVELPVSLKDNLAAGDVLAYFVNGQILSAPESLTSGEYTTSAAYQLRSYENPQTGETGVAFESVSWGNDLTARLEIISSWSWLIAEDGKLKFNLNIFGNDILLYIQIITVPSSDPSGDLEPYDLAQHFSIPSFNYSILNTGSYDMYPEFWFTSPTNKQYSVKVNGNTVYDYHLAYETPMSIDCSTGFATINGTLAENANYSYDTNEYSIVQPVVESSINHGRCIIPSGSPELFKIRVLSFHNSINLFDPVSPPTLSNFGVLSFAVYGTPHYDHDNAIAFLFKDVAWSHRFNTGGYPYAPVASSSAYVSDFDWCQLLPDVVMSRITQDNKTYYTLMGDLSSLESIDFTEMSEMYCSVCNATNVEVVGTTGSVLLQTRDAF